MSTILYHNGALVTDSGFVRDLANCEEYIFNYSKSFTKMMVSDDRSCVIATTGNVLGKDVLKDISNFLSLMVKNVGVLSQDDDLLKERLIRIARKTRTELSMIVMEKISEQIYTINVFENKEHEVDLLVKKIQYDDVFGIGSGSTFGTSCFYFGDDLVTAAKKAVMNDPVSNFPLHVITMDDLVKTGLTEADEILYLESLKEFLS